MYWYQRLYWINVSIHIVQLQIFINVRMINKIMINSVAKEWLCSIKLMQNPFSDIWHVENKSSGNKESLIFQYTRKRRNNFCLNFWITYWHCTSANIHFFVCILYMQFHFHSLRGESKVNYFLCFRAHLLILGNDLEKEVHTV